MDDVKKKLVEAVLGRADSAKVKAARAISEEETILTPRKVDSGPDHEFVQNLLGLPDDGTILSGPAGLFANLTDAQKIGILIMRQGERHATAINTIAENGCNHRASDLELIYSIKRRVDRLFWVILGVSGTFTTALVVLGIVYYVKDVLK